MWIWFCRRTLPYENLYGAVVFDDDVCNFYFFRLLWKNRERKREEKKELHDLSRETRRVFTCIRWSI